MFVSANALEHGTHGASLPPTEIQSMVKTKKPTSARRVAEHAKQQRAVGLCRLSVWVPQARRPELLRIAMQMRAEGGCPLPDDSKPDTPPIRIPVPTVEKPAPGTVSIRSNADEIWLHMLLRENGGEWHGQSKVWTLRRDVAQRLGLQSRFVR